VVVIPLWDLKELTIVLRRCTEMKKQIKYAGIKAGIAFYFFFSCIQLPAQLLDKQVCSGGVGSPNGGIGVPEWFNFFKNGKYPGDSLPRSKTSYSYTSGSCPAEGQYTITNSLVNCPGDDWHTGIGAVSTDSLGGNFMLVNGSAIPGDVYVDTMSNLCGDTRFLFEISFTSLALPTSCGGHPSMPYFTITIQAPDGSVLGGYFTGPIDANTSDTYDVPFATPPGVNSAIVRVTDGAPGGCGNAFGMAVLVAVQCLPEIVPHIESYFCSGGNSFAQITTRVGPGFSDPAFQWQVLNDSSWVDIAGATFLNYNASVDTGSTAKYRIEMAEKGNMGIMTCRVPSAIVPIYQGIPDAQPIVTSNSPVCSNKTIFLTATGGSSYQWTGPGGFTSVEQSPSFTASNASAGQYAVVISDNFGCKVTGSTTVTMLTAPKAVVNGKQSICLGDSVILEASGGDTYTWVPTINLSDPAASNPIAKPTSTTRYIVAIVDSNYCSDTASVLVVVNPKPIVNAGGEKAVIKGQSITLDGSVGDPTSVEYGWVPSPTLNNIHLLDPVANPDVNTNYVLTATSIFGCGNTADTAIVKVLNLGVPNAFTPNGDGRNDIWHIPALQAFPNAVVTVYNRYGQKVFESSGGNKDWDGRYRNADLPAGAYVYAIDLKNNNPVIKGTVIIVR
jgi:gliding motility-associated-like protein